MARLRTVESWPSTRFAERPWHSDDDLAAFLGASRGLFDLYSSELPEAELTARSSTVRFFLMDEKSLGDFEVDVPERYYEGFDMGRIRVPQSFSALGGTTRIAVALEVIHAGVRALGEVRGWDRDRLDTVRERVVARGLRFVWTSPWKASPGRRHQARAVFWLDEVGHGRVQLEIRRTADGEVTARGDVALAYMTVEGFRRSAATLRWHGTETVHVVPWSGILGDDGVLTLHVDADVLPSAVPGPIAISLPAVSVTTAVVRWDAPLNPAT